MPKVVKKRIYAEKVNSSRESSQSNEVSKKVGTSVIISESNEASNLNLKKIKSENKKCITVERQVQVSIREKSSSTSETERPAFKETLGQNVNFPAEFLPSEVCVNNMLIYIKNRTIQGLEANK